MATTNQYKDAITGKTYTGVGYSEVADTSSNPVIPVSTLTTPTPAITVPTPPVTVDSSTDLFNKYISNQPAPVNTSDLYAQANQAAGIQDKTQIVNDLSAQVNKINADAQAAQQTLESQSAGKDVTSAFLGKQQQEISRQAAIKALPLSAELSAAQGNLKAAQDNVNTLYKLKSEDATNQYNYKTNLLKSVYDFADKTQQSKLNALQKEADNKFKLEQDKLNFEQQKELARYNSSLNIQEEKAKAGLTAQTAEAAKESQSLATINTVNNLLDDPNFNATFGISNIIGRNIAGTPSYTVKANVTNLISQLALAARGQLKGQGAVSDFEGKMLKDAQTALKLNMNADQARKELIKVRGAIRTSSGLTAPVKITDPKTKQTQILDAGSAGIQQAIKDGLTVEYQ
jgi:hypothetical protein